jgi:hypothetical protein
LKKRTAAGITAMGVVTPAKWDESDKVVGVSIQTLDEKEYIVELDKIGKALITLIHNRVEAVGSVRKRLDGKLVMRIKQYRRIDNYENYRKDIHEAGVIDVF